MKERQTGNALQRFFSGISEHVFQSQLGVVDPALTDYVSDLLIRFVRWDTVYRVRNLSGRPVKYIGDMLAEADARMGVARREVHQHVGDFTLFWAGVYPESLRGRAGRAGPDQYGDYCVHGKRAYLIASSIDVDESAQTSNDVLERLGKQFEMCAYGLREIRREWERPDENDGQRSIWKQ